MRAWSIAGSGGGPEESPDFNRPWREEAARFLVLRSGSERQLTVLWIDDRKD